MNQPRERTRVLIVDDSPELTAYVSRLLADQCTVFAVHDGADGLKAARNIRPDLILVDVMMPGMDGFALLNAIRADDAIHTVSVMMLSANASEEARMKALDAGADDYLVKPFRSRELIARIRTHVRMVKIRRAAVKREGELLRQIGEVQNNLQTVLEGTNDAFISLTNDFRIVTLNDAGAKLINASASDLSERVLTEVVPGIAEGDLGAALGEAMTRQVATSAEHFHAESGQWYSVRCYPTVHGVTIFGTNITERKLAESALHQAHSELELRVAERTRELHETHKLLAAVFDRAPSGIVITDIEGNFIRTNSAYQELVRYDQKALLHLSLKDISYPEDFTKKLVFMEQILRGERDAFAIEMRYRLDDGSVIWVNDFVSMIRDEQIMPAYFVQITQDITQRKHAEEKVRASQQQLCMLYDTLQTVREEERVAISREVHDQLGQLLSAAKIDIKLLEEDIRPKDAPLSRRKIATELRSARRSIDEAIESVRRIATELRPLELDRFTLREAIEGHVREFERRTRIACHVDVGGEVGALAGPAATTLFRILQEAMTNILRHARASSVWISVRCRGNGVRLRVRDNGVGILPAHVRSSRSIGLKGMRERAAMVEGRVAIGPLRAGGTLVSAQVPLNADVGALSPQHGERPFASWSETE